MKYNWVIAQNLLVKMNALLCDYNFKLVEPDPARAVLSDEGTFWLLDDAGEIFLDDIVLDDAGNGFVANMRDGSQFNINPDMFRPERLAG